MQLLHTSCRLPEKSLTIAEIYAKLDCKNTTGESLSCLRAPTYMHIVCVTFYRYYL